MITNSRRKFIIYGVVIILMALASVLFFHSFQPDEETETRWRSIAPASVENHITLLAHVQAAEQYLIGVPFDSHVSKLNVREGQAVHKGDLLLELDSTPLQMAFRDAKAQFFKARQAWQNLHNWESSNEVTSAQRTLIMAEMSERDALTQLNEAEPLYHQGIIARSERDSLSQQLASRRIELQAARQVLKSTRAQGSEENQTMAELELDNARQKLQDILDQQTQSWLYAPADGYAVRIQGDEKDKVAFPKPGQRVSKGEPLFIVAGVTRFEARAKADEADIEHLRVGMPVTLTSDALPSQTLSGKLQMVSPQANFTEGQPGATYDVIFSLDCCHGQQPVPRFGMSALMTITIFSDPSGMVLLPDEIGEDAQGRKAVYFRHTPQSPSELRDINVIGPVPQGILVGGLEAGEVRKWDCCGSKKE
jgi:multidrug resistance efflux pump